MRKFTTLLAILTVAGLQAPSASPVLAEPTSGAVVKVDPTSGKITLQHDPIKNLDMDSMTMVFRLADPAMVKTIKPGDRVIFEAERVNGQITVTSIRKLTQGGTGRQKGS